MSEPTDFLGILQEAAAHSVQHNTPVAWLHEDYGNALEIRALDGHVWKMTLSALIQSLQELKNPVLVEILHRTVQTSSGREKLLEAAISAARQRQSQRQANPTVWDRLILED